MNPYVAILNDIKAHLLAQGERAMNSNLNCVYRTDDGRSCAVGCLIPDNLYDPNIETASAKYLIDGIRLDEDEEFDPRAEAVEKFAPLFFAHLQTKYGPMERDRLIDAMSHAQEVHDENLPNEWGMLMDAVIERFNSPN